MNSLSMLGAVSALLGAMAASAVQAAPFTVVQRTSAGDQDISEWIDTETFSDSILGGEILSEVRGEIQWSDELKGPFLAQDGQLVGLQEGVQSVERTDRVDYFNYDQSGILFYPDSLRDAKPSQIVITNTGAQAADGRTLNFSGYLGDAELMGDVQLLIDGQAQTLYFSDADPEGTRYWGFSPTAPSPWMTSGYSQITLTMSNGAYLTDGEFWQFDNVQFVRSEVVTSSFQDQLFQTVPWPSPVPEPSTWALGLLGLAVLGWRRSSSVAT